MYDFISRLLKMEANEKTPERIAFMQKFQQLSGPVMAKGVEDTVFYRYNRLLSLNEVGGNPAHFGISVAAFHSIQASRAAHWPHSMIATATHDTKRGEDMRMRLHVLSEIPHEWGAMLQRWARLNRSRRKELDRKIVPSGNDEYFIYQTLLGSWPVELMETPLDKSVLEHYCKRVCEYMLKAMREAKFYTSWGNPDESYENGVLEFIRLILSDEKSSLFLEDFTRAARKIAKGGMINSISQAVLKLTLPGVPDMYQGTERWDLSLVDPDNRRPVDYPLRELQIQSQHPLPSTLEHWQDAEVKQLLITKLLAHRSIQPDIYAYGDYKPIAIKGKHASRVIAFSRTFQAKTIIVVIPVRVFSLSADEYPVGDVWENTGIELPGMNYRNMLTQELHADGMISSLFARFPAAVLCDTGNNG